jgi:hypothetical protein
MRPQRRAPSPSPPPPLMCRANTRARWQVPLTDIVIQSTPRIRSALCAGGVFSCKTVTSCPGATVFKDPFADDAAAEEEKAKAAAAAVAAAAAEKRGRIEREANMGTW